MAQWWERSLPTNVAWVRHLPGAICGPSLLMVLVLAPRVFLWVLRFSSSSLYKSQHSKFQFDLATVDEEPLYGICHCNVYLFFIYLFYFKRTFIWKMMTSQENQQYDLSASLADNSNLTTKRGNFNRYKAFSYRHLFRLYLSQTIGVTFVVLIIRDWAAPDWAKNLLRSLLNKSNETQIPHFHPKPTSFPGLIARRKPWGRGWFLNSTRYRAKLFPLLQSFTRAGVGWWRGWKGMDEWRSVFKIELGVAALQILSRSSSHFFLRPFDWQGHMIAFEGSLIHY